MTEPRPLSLDDIEADPALRSRDNSGVAAIAIGTAAWVVALVLVVAFGESWGIDAPRWTLICALGALLGIPGLALVLRHRSRMRRQAASPPA